MASLTRRKTIELLKLVRLVVLKKENVAPYSLVESGKYSTSTGCWPGDKTIIGKTSGFSGMQGRDSIWQVEQHDSTTCSSRMFLSKRETKGISEVETLVGTKPYANQSLFQRWDLRKVFRMNWKEETKKTNWFSWRRIWYKAQNKYWLPFSWETYRLVLKKSFATNKFLLTSSLGLAATIASDVEPKRTDTGEKVSYGPHSSALLTAAARHGAGSAPPHETGIGLIPGRLLKVMTWSLLQLIGIGLVWLMVHHPSSTGAIALIGLLLFGTNPGEANFLQWIKTQAPLLAKHKEAKIDKLRVRIAPYLFNLQDWTLWNLGVCTIIHVRDFADYVYIYIGILGRWVLLGWWKDPELKLFKDFFGLVFVKMESAWWIGEETKPSPAANAIRTLLRQQQQSKNETKFNHCEEFIPISGTNDDNVPTTGVSFQWTRDFKQQTSTTVEDGHFSFPYWVTNEETKEGIKNAPHPVVALHYEILEFVRFVSSTEDEVQKREALVNRITDIVRQLWPNATVHVFGSFATNLFLPTSDIDLCILNSPEEGSKRELHHLANLLRQKNNNMRRVFAIDKARVPIIKVTDRDTGLQCDICFGQREGIKNVACIRKYLRKYPPLRPLLLVIKCFLHQHALNEVYEGGFGSYLLLLSIVSHLQLYPMNFPLSKRRNFIHNLGSLLLSYLQLYGRLLNYMTTGICLREGGYYYEKKKRYPFEATRPNLLSLEDPRDSANELGRNSFAASRVRSVFSQGYECLKRWDPSLLCTPLSLIIKQDAVFEARMELIEKYLTLKSSKREPFHKRKKKTFQNSVLKKRKKLQP
eukprot:jgi/Galph1/5402/GphlegSOOS_G4065.1